MKIKHFSSDILRERKKIIKDKNTRKQNNIRIAVLFMNLKLKWILF